MKAHLEPEEETMAQHSCEDEPSGPWVCVRGWEERELGSGLTLGCHRTAWTPEASGEKGGPAEAWVAWGYHSSLGAWVEAKAWSGRTSASRPGQAPARMAPVAWPGGALAQGPSGDRGV